MVERPSADLRSVEAELIPVEVCLLYHVYSIGETAHWFLFVDHVVSRRGKHLGQNNCVNVLRHECVFVWRSGANIRVYMNAGHTYVYTNANWWGVKLLEREPYTCIQIMCALLGAVDVVSATASRTRNISNCVIGRKTPQKALLAASWIPTDFSIFSLTLCTCAKFHYTRLRCGRHRTILTFHWTPVEVVRVVRRRIAVADEHESVFYVCVGVWNILMEYSILYLRHCGFEDLTCDEHILQCHIQPTISNAQTDRGLSQLHLHHGHENVQHIEWEIPAKFR